ncbi:NAD-binding protein [Nocardia asteroides]
MVLIGLGRFGSALARELVDHGSEVLAIDAEAVSRQHGQILVRVSVTLLSRRNTIWANGSRIGRGMIRLTGIVALREAVGRKHTGASAVHR